MIFLLFSLLLLIFQRVNAFSVSAYIQILWGFPAFLYADSLDVIIIYSVAISVSIVFGAIISVDTRKYEVECNISFLYVSLILLVSVLSVIVFNDRGIGGFLAGKYGSAPGGNIYLYYVFNSMVYVSVLMFLCSPRVSRFIGLFAVMIYIISVALLFLYGDRTILIFCIFLFLLKVSYGVRLTQLIKRPVVITAVLIGFCAVVFGKSFHAYYITGQWESSIDLGLSLKKIESWHNYYIIKSVVESNIEYSFDSLMFGMLSFFPGSSVFGVDPHGFSSLLKENFFSDWGDDKGVGANIYAQFYSVAGWLGFGVILIVQNIYICFLHFIINKKKIGMVHLVLMSFSAPIVFYIYRNSLEQVLSFSGRYATLIVFIATLAFVYQSIFNRPIR